MAEDKIKLEFPDGSVTEYESGVTGYEVAESISKGLAREALSITLDGEIYDLDHPLTEGGKIKINTWDDEDGKYTFWHSSAHILAEAVEELYPDAKFGIGPPIDRGFYYDIDFGDRQIGQNDLEEIEENDWNLNVPRYVDTTEPEEPIDVSEKLRELDELAEERRKTDQELQQYMEELEYR